jgi:large subunit ribosomal protein L21
LEFIQNLYLCNPIFQNWIIFKIMYAIVEIAGQQFKVEKNQKVYVHRLEAEEGSKVDFDKVLLIEDDGKIQVGSPVIENTVVSAKVVSHLKGDKVLVFKKKRRKGYQKMNGHRQYMTEILVEDIKAAAAKAKKSTKKAEKPAEEAEAKAE